MLSIFDWVWTQISSNWLDVLSKVIVGLAAVIILSSAQRIWAVLAALANRLLGRDAYRDLYGLWHVYRISGDGEVLDTTIEIRRSIFREKPSCVFTTSHIAKSPWVSAGYCALEGTNIVFVFDTSKSAPRQTSGRFYTFAYWFVNDGAREFAELKAGYLCGGLSTGALAFAPVVMSRRKLAPEVIDAALIKTKRLGIDGALKLVNQLEKGSAAQPAMKSLVQQ